MQLRTILFPSDFSRCGDAALHLATSLARDSGAKLLIVHVEEPSNPYSRDVYYSSPDPRKVKDYVMLQSIVPDDPQVCCEHHLITGNPASALVRFAEDHEVDLIIIGTHGRTGVLRLLMGSVAEAVVRKASCPVLTVKQPREAAVLVDE